jgi:hypothetical protein
MTSTLPPLVQAFSGAIGSASANTLTYPLDLVTTRLQLDSPEKARRSSGLHGAIRILRGIIKKHGFQDLYTGLGTDTGATLLSKYVLCVVRRRILIHIVLKLLLFLFLRIPPVSPYPTPAVLGFQVQSSHPSA